MEIKTDTLESLCALIVDCPHSTPKWTDKGITVLRNQCIRNGTLDLSNPSFTNEEDYQKRVKRAVPQAGDIVFTREAPMGEVCLIPKGLKCCLGQRQVLLRPRKDISGDYLFWALQSPYVQHQISWNEGTGTTVSNVRIPVLKALKIPRYPQNEAKAAGILSAIANKIQLNRQTNKTLEAMAQALFKSWFVDFDPVIDNALAAGNPIPDALQKRAEQRRALHASDHAPAPLPDEIRQLFPASFVFDAEMGWIPAGWGVQPLDKIAHYQNGLALQKFRPEDDTDFLPVVKIAQLKKGFADGEEKASPKIKPECILDNGDVVFSWSGSLMVDIWCGGKAALNQHLFRVTSEQYPKWFYFWHTKHHLREFQRIAADKAVTMGHIKRSHLAQAKCAIPPASLLNLVGSFLSGFLERQINTRLQSQDLTKLRDTLLPKLISGELKLPAKQPSQPQQQPEAALA